MSFELIVSLGFIGAFILSIAGLYWYLYNKEKS